jgi:hypothetical protein
LMASFSKEYPRLASRNGPNHARMEAKTADCLGKTVA